MSQMSQGSSPDTAGFDSGKSGFDPARLIATYQAGVWRYLRALGCDRDLAEDITQDTFLAVLQKPFEDYDPKATRAYLRTVARNLFISSMRRSGKTVAVENIDQLDVIWGRWVGEDNGEELLTKLKNCLESLTNRARWALEMRFKDRLPRTKIADKLGITEHGAKNLMQRAKKQLRECIDQKTPT
jgi:RNA polymerase sigma-70 factor (ECF subfamily)